MLRESGRKHGSLSIYSMHFLQHKLSTVYWIYVVYSSFRNYGQNVFQTETKVYFMEIGGWKWHIKMSKKYCSFQYCKWLYDIYEYQCQSHFSCTNFFLQSLTSPHSDQQWTSTTTWDSIVVADPALCDLIIEKLQTLKSLASRTVQSSF